MAQPLASDVTSLRNQAGAYANKAAETAGDVADQVKTAASDLGQVAAEHGAKAARQVERGAITAYASTKRFVEEQPVLAIAGAAAVCFAVGAIWKLSQRNRVNTGYGFIDRLANSAEPAYRDLKKRYL